MLRLYPVSVDDTMDKIFYKIYLFTYVMLVYIYFKLWN